MERNNKRNKILLVCIFSLFLGITSCAQQAKPASDVLTMKKTEEGKTQITVLVKHAFSIRGFEEIIEKKFPDIDLVQVGNYTSNTVLAKEYEARLEHDDLPDMVMTWPLDVGEQYWEDRLIDLSGMGFTNQYKTSMLDDIANEEGRLYYLPGPAEMRSIVYNKTLFEEKGWQVPTTYAEFISLCKQIDESGIRAFQLPLKNKEVLNTAFMMFRYGSYISKPSDIAWLEKFNKEEVSFGEHFETAFSAFQSEIEEGLFREEDLEVDYARAQRNLFERKIAMSEDSVLLTTLGSVYGNETDTFALMPLFNMDSQSDWVRLYMTCYVGLNNHLLDEENEEKYEKVLSIMEYISTNEGQQALASDGKAMFSSLKTAIPPNIEEISDVLPALQEGRYGVFTPFENCTNAFEKGMQSLIRKSTSAQEVIRAIDLENKQDRKKEKIEVLTKASSDFTQQQTGEWIAQMMQQQCRSDFALLLDNGKDGKYNGKGIGARLYQGDVTDVDVDRIVPDFMHQEKGEIWEVKIKGEDLLKTMEYSMEINGNTGWFYYTANLQWNFDPYAKLGKRVSNVKTKKNKKIDANQVYSVAIVEDSIPEQYIIEKKKTGLVLKEVIKDICLTSKTIHPNEDVEMVVLEK